MDTYLFSMGGYEVTAGVATIGGAALTLVLIVLVMVALRRDRARIVEMADRAADGLRASFIQQVADRDARIRALEQRLDAQIEENSALRAEAAATRATMIEQSRQSEENLQRFMGARQQMSDEFKALAGEVLRSQSETFTKQNREQVDTLLKPLGEKINEFHTGLVRDRAALGQHIQTLLQTGMSMSQEANNLARALKGNSQSQGAWGEMILSTILEKSGLRDGEQFRTQQTHTGEDGARVRTDVEVDLPNGDKIIIDSKVSLNAFDLYVNAPEDEDRSQHLRAHIASIRSHIKTLAGKDYARKTGSGLDCVLMFLPIEPAFSEAMKADPSLLDYAHGMGVYLTTPTTLMTTLRTIRNLWDIERRHRNAEEIAERAGALYDKVFGFLSNMDALGKSIERAKSQFEDTRNQLSGGRGSVVRQVEMLRDLGAKTSKTIPASWTENAAVEVVEHRAQAITRSADDGDWLAAFDEDQPRLLAGE